MFRLTAASLLLLFLALQALAAPGITLRRTDGTAAELALGGRPAVLFYEDRSSYAWNQPLKDALFARGRTRGMLDRVRVIAVANIAAFDFFPAREIAMRFVGQLEGRVGVPILLDVDGALTRPPWSLPAGGAAVVVFDSRGERVLERRGRLSPDDVEATLATLERLVADGGP
jgi:hypothetical protein